MRLLLLLGLLVSSGAFAEERVFGDYRVVLSNDKSSVMASTANADGEILGYFCEFSSKQCSYMTSIQQDCVKELRYPVLIGTNKDTLNASLVCLGSIEGGRYSSYLLSPFREIKTVTGGVTIFGYATANADGTFTPHRFSTKGMKEAFDYVSSTFFNAVQSTTKDITLWDTIEKLAQQIPFTKTKVEHLLSTVLTETDNTGNDVFQFYKSGRVELGGGVAISNVDLRIKRQGPHPGFMVLDISGACIKLDQVRSNYGEMQITDVPRGHSLDEETSYSTMRTWGKLSFGFAERTPDCLASIAFDPKEMK